MISPRSAPALSALLALGVALGAGPALAVPLVVLDPGHGGAHLGCKSTGGTPEKVLALAIARQAKAHLVKAGIRVRMTRSDDRHVPLAARPALAHRLDADAFVSIHLNHAPDPDRRGWETYVRSAEASDEFTRRLLAQEEGEMAGDHAGESATSDLEFILGDLSRGVAHEQSARLAKAIQDSVRGVEGLLPSRGLRQAPFIVLTGARVPAVLVEVGYLSNDMQAEFLASARGQRLAGRAVARGVMNFLRAGGVL